MATVVVQARMGSTRLPGKVLADVGGRPLLGLMLARLEPLDHHQVVVATSDLPQDDPVAEVAATAGVGVVRGPERDVLARFVLAVDAHPSDTVVRLTADCPLTDPALVMQAIQWHHDGRADYTSNTLLRSFPDGLDVEVVRAGALREADAEAADPVEREHVTPFVYRRPERYRLAHLVGSEPLGQERWTIDTAGDLDWLRHTIAAVPCPERASWREILSVVGQNGTAAGGPRLRPVAPAPEEGSVRTWLVQDGGTVVGSVAVRVRGGVGRYRIETEAAREDQVLALLRQALTADCQVRELLREEP